MSRLSLKCFYIKSQKFNESQFNESHFSYKGDYKLLRKSLGTPAIICDVIGLKVDTDTHEDQFNPHCPRTYCKKEIVA